MIIWIYRNRLLFCALSDKCNVVKVFTVKKHRRINNSLNYRYLKMNNLQENYIGKAKLQDLPEEVTNKIFREFTDRQLSTFALVNK